MNNNKNRGMSGAPFLIFIVLVLGSLWYMGRMQQQGQEITYSAFVDAVENHDVDEVYITQNKTAPTGIVTVSFKDTKSVKVIYVSDVNAVQEFLNDADVDYHMGNIKEDSWVTTAVVPALIVVVGVFLIFVLMNRQGGGGSTKAMNFGKSRARMSGPRIRR